MFDYQLLVVLTVVLALMAPAAMRVGVPGGLLVISLKTVFGLLLPCAGLFLSFLLVPTNKVEADFDALSMWHAGKITLLPIVVWACAAFYAVEILVIENRDRYWIILGLMSGAVVGLVALVITLLVRIEDFKDVSRMTISQWEWVIMVYSTPLFVTVWYGARGVLLLRETQLDGLKLAMGALINVPFWLASVWVTRTEYEKLPDQLPADGHCFVVTAAAKGHARCVGKPIVIERAGETRLANQQLLNFWQFEALWQQRWPVSHRCFRCWYNRYAPALAKRITNRWLADVVYVLLKPFEYIAVFLKQHLTR